MDAIVFTGAGGNEVVGFEERPDPVPSGGEVLVAVRYAALNPADQAQREGRYPAPPGSPTDVPGLEVAGTVIACGPAVLGLAPGDRVFGLVGGGGLASKVLVHELHVTRVPAGLDDLAAAAVPEAFVTAHDAIMSQAGLRPGELLVVNGANGGVGTAAVQIAAAAGARVLATVRDTGLRDQVASLGATVIDPSELVTRAQADGGADVVLELVGGPNLDPDLLALAMKGRIVIVGTGGGSEALLDLRKLMSRRARLLGTMLRARPLDEKATAMRAFTREVVPHLASGRIAPIVDRVFPASEAAAALDRLAEPGKLGKVLLDFGTYAAPSNSSA
jgi:NADPH:quinone reductase-like Zn-dependent oxidoreductase